MRVEQKIVVSDGSLGFGSPVAAVGRGYKVGPVTSSWCGAARRQPGWVAAITVAVLVSGWAQVARAQETARLVGRVHDVRTARPLADVSITLLDTGAEARTNSRGEYRLPSGTAAEVNVRLVLVGYATAVERVALTGNRTIADFELAPVDVVLDELIVWTRSPRVVEGQGDLAVRTVDLEEVLGPSAGDVLKNIPGVLVLQPSGQVGSGSKIQLRGLRSLFSESEPLVYVDGVRTSSLSLPLIGVRGQSMLDLIPLSQIDRIEVLIGPAATTRYGMGALSGVIHIYTKKGPVRKPD